jgi:glucosamine--fructose-6-phosphate aminotransferase (isomerizing)
MAFIDEILEQPEAIRRAVNSLAQVEDQLAPIRRRIESGDIDRIVFSGMGGSYSAGEPLLVRLNRNGKAAFGINAAELLHARGGVLTPSTLLILATQSGESVETVNVAERWHGQATILSLTNRGDDAVSRLADFPFAFNAGTEATVSSKTYTGTLAALALIGTALAGEDMARTRAGLDAAIEAVAQVLKNHEAVGAQLLDALQIDTRLMLLARGPSMATAANGALILKESTHIFTEGMNCGEFRHGPIEATGPGWPTLVFLPHSNTQQLTERLVRDLLDLSVRVVVVGPTNPDPRAGHVALPALDADIAPIAEIVPVHILAYHLARSFGMVPGQFARMGKVTTSE